MKIIQNAYTLVELIVTVALLVIVLTGGTAIFYRSFRSSALSDIQTSANNSVRAVSDAIERNIRFGTVTRIVDGGDFKRADCLAAGNAGVTGTSLSVSDLSGGSTVYSLSNGVIASNAAVISNPSVEVTKLQFKWYCTSGVNDKINLLIEARSSSAAETSAPAVSSVDINLLNSGIN